MNLLYLSLILTVWVGEQKKKAKLANCVHVTLSRQALSKTHGATCTTNHSTLDSLILHTYIQLHA